MLKEIEGDLIDMAKRGMFSHIVHGCNCFNTMEAGIALKIAKAFPNARYVDEDTLSGDLSKLGNYSESVEHLSSNGEFNRLTIINAYTQFKLGREFMLSALHLILYKLEETLPRHAKIGFPLIGCGIGGGSEKDVRFALNIFAVDRDVTLVTFPKHE